MTYGTGLAGFIALIAGGISDSAFVGVGVLLLALMTLIPLIHVADRLWRRKKHHDLEAVADRVTALLSPLAEAVEHDAVSSEPVVQQEAARSRLDASLLDEEQQPASTPTAPRQRTRNA